MATPAQIAANRLNAQKSTGPRTTQGKERSSLNSCRFGLFTSTTFVTGEDREFYEMFCAELWEELAPAGAVEEIHAGEFIRAAWRLRRCALVEEVLGWNAEAVRAKQSRFTGLDLPARDPMLEPNTSGWQTSVDRARGAAHSTLRRAHADLTRLHAISSAQNEPNSIAETTAVPAFAQNEPNSALESITASALEQNEPNSGDLPGADHTKRTQFRFAA